MSRQARASSAVVLLAGLLAACGSSGATSGSPASIAPIPQASATATATSSAAASARAIATPTAAAAASQLLIEGFEGWSVFNPTSVDASADAGTLVLKLTRRALWFQGQRGVLVWKPLDGDFRITATVGVARTSDSSAPLDEGGAVRLAGLMAHADSVRQNYVFIVVGADADGLSVETKSTRDNASRFEGPAWPAPSADLRLCRSGATFTLLKRAAGSSDPWVVAATIERPDLLGELQVGPNLYSDSQPDVTARFTNLELEPLASGSACAD